MNIIIQRKEQTKSAIAGTLHIDGQYICDTAENRHTALPAGTYQIVRHFCKQYNRFMPLIRHPEFSSGSVKELVSGSKNHQWDCSLLTARCEGCSPQKTEDKEVSLNTILPCYCPMLKPGNGVHHRNDGSILLGTQIIPGCLSHPLHAFEPLADRIRKAIKRNKVITLVILTIPL